MSRINDLGGMQGFGAVAPEDDPAPFAADWEARVFALASVLQARGVFASDELRDAIERLPPDEYLTASYYERWFAATCTLLVERGIVDAAELESGDAS